MNSGAVMSTSDLNAALRMEFAGEMFSRPSMIQQAQLEWLSDFAFGAAPCAFVGGGTLRKTPAAKSVVPEQLNGYMLHGSTAVVSIVGPLLHRSTFITDYFGVDTYLAVRGRLAAALDDSAVRRIVIDLDTPGGAVAGAFTLAQWIFEARGSKPIIAVPNELAASAGYLIAAAADQIVIPLTARVGSIGIVIAHLNIGGAMASAGYSVNYIHAGAKKIDGHPFAALPARVRTDLQTEVDATYDLFVDRVASYRKVSADRVRATEAGMFTGPRAIQAGLADRLGTLRSVIG